MTPWRKDAAAARCELHNGAAAADDDCDFFFESLDRVPSSISVNLHLAASSGSESEEDDDVRISFASAIDAGSMIRRARPITSDDDDEEDDVDDDKSRSGGAGQDYNYGFWMDEPMSIKERRRHLLQGMGLASRKDLRRDAFSLRRLPSSAGNAEPSAAPSTIAATATITGPSTTTPSPLTPPAILKHSKSDASRTSGGLSTMAALFRSYSEPWNRGGRNIADRQNRSLEAESPSTVVSTAMAGASSMIGGGGGELQSAQVEMDQPCPIKNLDTGKEFILSEVAKDGGSKLNDRQTGIQFTLEEFERILGYSPIVKELMRRVNLGGNRGVDGSFSRSAAAAGKENGAGGKSTNSSLPLLMPKPSKAGKSAASGGHGGGVGSRKKGGWLKNIRFMASSVTGLITNEKEKGVAAPFPLGGGVATAVPSSTTSNGNSSSDWRMKVRQHGKSYKELTGLYMCQEIQAHQGSIWTLKFSSDSRFLASAGEDRVIHVWQANARLSAAATAAANDDDHKSMRRPSSSEFHCDSAAACSQRVDDPAGACASSASSPNVCSAAELQNGSGRAAAAGVQSKKGSRKGKTSSLDSCRSLVPDNIVMPETIYSLSYKPICSFHGHLDDVLDLSWSKSQYLLSSSMDKTVRLWDMETMACLKLFAHNDYVTCIQFNPIDEDYFISGSLDAKVRLWSIPDRQVVDWSDLHEMVTAVCYTPDGQGALVGSHKGSCHFYNTSEIKLCLEGQVDIRNKKKKSQAKKITGFQFAPDNPFEVLITSADSQIRVFDGVDMVQKFRGFRNINSQISASFTSDGKYVVCASEDSHVYVWKRDATSRATGAVGRRKGSDTIRSQEHFHCKDVSVAVPWPGSGRSYKPTRCSPSCAERFDSAQLSSSQRSTITLHEDNFHSSRSQDSPLDERSNPSCSGSTIGSSPSLTSASGPLRPPAAISASSLVSSFASWGWHGSSRPNGMKEEASAWGLVIVTAGLGGSIRIYQNFGLPLRLSRQPNLF